MIAMMGKKFTDMLYLASLLTSDTTKQAIREHRTARFTE